MQITAQALAALVSGEIDGDPNVSVSAPSKIEEAQEGTITFLANPKYENYLYTTNASIVLVNRSFVPKQEVKATLVKVDDVYATLSLLLSQFGNGMKVEPGISEQSSISKSAQIADNVSVGPFVVVAANVSIGSGTEIYSNVYLGPNVVVGNNVVIYPGVKIYSNCKIGDNCILHSNAVIGSDGFGFRKNDKGQYEKLEQIGNVVLESDVEIGANTAIDRATMGSTIIRKGTKLDNLIQIAHNVEIGENTAIAAQTGIAGSTKIGERVLIGGQVGITGHIEVANDVSIQGGSGISSSVKEEGAKLYGYPAFEYVQYLRSYNVFKKLPDLLKRLEYLEKKLEEND
jgi:UDP-3-O-[3-hydroxymyristoyl] glucosamine N-acyltransferase